MGHTTVGELAKRYAAHGVRPKDISDLFYARQLRDDLCPIVSGRRLIPLDYVEMIEMALRRAGKLPLLPRREVRNAAR